MFPLTNLPPALLEQIIKKLEGKSYLRLQQTCRYVAEFIQTNQHIEVYLQVECKFRIPRAYEYETRFHPYWLILNGRKISCLNLQSLYGVRIAAFMPPPEIEDSDLEEVCNTLRTRRITAQEMDMSGSYGNLRLTKEQCSLLFTTLQPTRFSLDSIGSNRFEAILDCRQQIMERATIYVEANDGVDAATHLLPRFQHVQIHIDYRLTQNERFSETILILEFLRVTPLPKLQSFEFYARYYEERPLPSIEEVVEKFSDFQAVAKKGPRSIPFTMKCRLGTAGSCDIRIEKDSMNILYPSVPSYRTFR